MSDLIPRLLDLACACDGVGVGTDRERYLQLVAHGERPGVHADMAKLSGCALFIRGLWRQLGVKDRRLMPPYVPGKAVTWLVQIAQERGAWVPSSPDKLPGPGDMVLVGGSDRVRDGGVEHVYTVIALQPNPLTIQSIDGGQVDHKRQQCIRRKTRQWVLRENAWWDVVQAGADPGANARGGRRVIGWADLERVVGRDLDGLTERT